MTDEEYKAALLFNTLYREEAECWCDLALKRLYHESCDYELQAYEESRKKAISAYTEYLKFKTEDEPKEWGRIFETITR